MIFVGKGHSARGFPGVNPRICGHGYALWNYFVRCGLKKGTRPPSGIMAKTTLLGLDDF